VELILLKYKQFFHHNINRNSIIHLFHLMEMLIELFNCNFFIIFSIEKDSQLKLIDGDRQGTIFTAFYKKIS
jgi:hypothetical protein